MMLDDNLFGGYMSPSSVRDTFRRGRSVPSGDCLPTSMSLHRDSVGTIGSLNYPKLLSRTDVTVQGSSFRWFGDARNHQGCYKAEIRYYDINGAQRVQELILNGDCRNHLERKIRSFLRGENQWRIANYGLRSKRLQERLLRYRSKW